eukprot:snap_masked-scaffold_7-processed-gene-2.20-mRNA-1 protein AED:1.00 eAED:1.00 QI:0/-1/0/0/-1/1/1/0/212
MPGERFTDMQFKNNETIIRVLVSNAETAWNNILQFNKFIGSMQRPDSTVGQVEDSTVPNGSFIVTKPHRIYLSPSLAYDILTVDQENQKVTFRINADSGISNYEAICTVEILPSETFPELTEVKLVYGVNFLKKVLWMECPAFCVLVVFPPSIPFIYYATKEQVKQAVNAVRITFQAYLETRNTGTSMQVEPVQNENDLIPVAEAVTGKVEM